MSEWETVRGIEFMDRVPHDLHEIALQLKRIADALEE